MIINTPIPQTRISVDLKNGRHCEVISADSMYVIIDSMKGELPPFFGFKDVKGHFVVFNTQEILSIYLVPNEPTDDTP